MLPIIDDVPRRRAGQLTWGLILANVVVFSALLGMPEQQLHRFFYLFGIVPARYTHPAWAAYVGFPVDDYWPFLTSMFLHGGWLHLIGNMWTIWIFGPGVEKRMGSLRFLAFYLLCGVLSGCAHSLTNPNSVVPAVGASGAIAGVMGAYFLLFPTARILVLFPVFFLPLFLEIPALFYLLYWFLIQFFSGSLALTSPGAAGGIAWWAHVGGFLAGILLLALFVRPERPRGVDVEVWDPVRREWRRVRVDRRE